MEPFNLDMIMEVLSRSSLQTISKCRLLSKDCNAFTYESLFRDLHSQRPKTISGFFIQFVANSKFYSQFVSSIDEQPALSLDFLPCRVQIKASTNIGILLCVKEDSRRLHEYYVCKPSTKQYRKLPNPKTRYSTLAIGMVVVKSNPLRYKIVRISKPKLCRYDFSNYCRTEIFDSETWSWKQVNAVSVPSDKFLVRKPAISAEGSLFWHAADRKTILAYNPEDDCCSTFCLPEEFYESSDIKFVEYEGRVAVVCDKGGLIELWIMKNNIGEKTWSKRSSMSCEDVLKEDQLAGCMAYYTSDVALFSGAFKLIFYNMKKKNTDHVVRVRNSICDENLFHFQSDYELVNFNSAKRLM